MQEREPKDIQSKWSEPGVDIANFFSMGPTDVIKSSPRFSKLSLYNLSLGNKIVSIP